MAIENETQHGIKFAYYSNSPAGLRPTLECLCGESFKEIDWESAGAMLDEHLDEIEKGGSK